jgi:hypothetical protein
MGIKEELTEMRKAMEKMTQELHETNVAIRESLKLTSDTIKEMSHLFHCFSHFCELFFNSHLKSFSFLNITRLI